MLSTADDNRSPRPNYWDPSNPAIISQIYEDINGPSNVGSVINHHMEKL